MGFKLMLIGEAYGEEEARVRQPFVGAAGKQLNELLKDAGISRSECYITNVFNLRPERNDLASLCSPRKDYEAAPGLPALTRGKYLRKEFLLELNRLQEEIQEVNPNLIVLLGNTAVWAVLQSGSISKTRGTCSMSKFPEGFKCLPTYHPAAILRQWDLRHVTVMDLIKAKRESETPVLNRPLRSLWIEPKLEDLEIFYSLYLKEAKYISVDIETAGGQVTCIAFSSSPEIGLVIPLLDYRFPGGHYWPSLEDEVKVWKFIRFVCDHPSARFVGQNLQYDTQYLWKTMGIPLRVDEDTMLLHHSLHPESPKSLAFMGSVYTNEIAWKPLRPRSKHNEKPEDEE